MDYDTELHHHHHHYKISESLMKSSFSAHENQIFTSRSEIAGVSQQKQHKKCAFLLCYALSLQEILHNISGAGFLWAS